MCQKLDRAREAPLPLMVGGTPGSHGRMGASTTTVGTRPPSEIADLIGRGAAQEDKDAVPMLQKYIISISNRIYTGYL